MAKIGPKENTQTLNRKRSIKQQIDPYMAYINFVLLCGCLLLLSKHG